MWKNLGNIKSGLSDLTSKTLTSVAKAGNRAKEIINQVDNDDFFEREFGNNVVENPLNNPLAKAETKPKKKEGSLKLDQETVQPGNRKNSLVEETQDISPIRVDNGLPKVYSVNKQKGKKQSSKADLSEAKTEISNQTNAHQSTQEPSAAAEDVLQGEVEDTWGANEPIIVETPTLVDEVNNGSGQQESGWGEAAADIKIDEPQYEPVRKQSENLTAEQKIVRERDELRELANTFQERINVLDKNLTVTLAKNTKLEDQVNKLSKDLVDARRGQKVSDIHTEVSEDRKESMNKYIRECIDQYKAEISSKLVETINKDLFDQLAVEEEEISEETRELMNMWIVRPETVQTLASDIIPDEKIIQPFYDENLLKEEIECQKEENHQLRTRAEEYEERIRQLESQLQEQQTGSQKYKQDTEQTLKKYTEDFVTLEQKIENLEEEMAEYKAVLKARNDDIKRIEGLSEEKDSLIRSLEDKIKSETLAKEDLNSQYEGLVQGMKEFEKTMLDLNSENERLTNEYESMKSQLTNETKRVKEFESSLSVEVKNNLLEKLSKLNSFYSDYEIEKAVDGKLVYKGGRVSAGGFANSLETALTLAIEKINRKIESQIEEEREKEREKYNVLSKNFDKLQAELKDFGKREKDQQGTKDEMKRKNEELTGMIENLNHSASQQMGRIKELQKTINELQEAKRKSLDDVGAKNEEIEQLKIKVNNLQEDNREKNGYLAQLEREAEAIPELSARIEKHQLEVQQLSELIQAKDEENEHLNMTINNLQSVIDENQHIQENLSNQYNTEIKKLRNDFEQASRKSQILQEYKDKFENIEKDSSEKEAKIKELNVKLKESEQERNAVKAEAAALVKKVKNETMYKENLVDKRVLTSFLVKYFDSNATFAVKLGVLETMASILAFTDDDRSKVGLPRNVPIVPEEKKEEEAPKTEQPTSPTSPTEESTGEEKSEEKKEGEQEKPPQPAKSFKQMFMSFLQE